MFAPPRQSLLKLAAAQAAGEASPAAEAGPGRRRLRRTGDRRKAEA